MRLVRPYHWIFSPGQQPVQKEAAGVRLGMCQGAINHPWAIFQAELRRKRGRAATFQEDPGVPPSKPVLGKPLVFQSISLEVEVMKVYAVRRGDCYSHLVCQGWTHYPDPAIPVEEVADEKEGSRFPASVSFNAPSSAWVFHVSSGLTARLLQQLPKVHSRLLFCLSSLIQLQPVAIPVAISTSPKPPESPVDPCVFDSASAHSNDLPSSMPKLSDL